MIKYFVLFLETSGNISIVDTIQHQRDKEANQATQPLNDTIDFIFQCNKLNDESPEYEKKAITE